MELLKDRFFLPESIEALAKAIINAYSKFDSEAFLKSVFVKQWYDLELMNRMRFLAEKLHTFLPDDFIYQLSIIKEVAPVLNNFDGIILPELVARYGMEYEEVALDTLRYLTRFSTSEFAIRPFIQRHPQKVMQFLLDCAKDENHHVRRWASEGCRPRLPWASPLTLFKKEPNAIIPILEALKADESAYVRKSVANNLNDISKDHPELVLHIAKKWYGKSKDTDKLLKHACRTLLKKGIPEAMCIFGFGDAEHICINGLRFEPDQVAIGESLQFTFELENLSEKATKLRIEYIVHYIKANGSTSKKVFPLPEKLFASGKTSLTKKHSFQERTTRKHYTGSHLFQIIVNGTIIAEGRVELHI